MEAYGTSRGTDFLDRKTQEMAPPMTSKDIDEFLDYGPDTANIQELANYREETLVWANQDFNEEGTMFPWEKMAPYAKLRSGELSIWTGKQGCGKSSLLNMVTMAAGAQDEVSCICSFEMRPQETLLRMAGQWSGIKAENMTDLSINNFFDDNLGKFYIYRQTGSVTPKRMLAIARCCAIKLHVKHLVIDSLMKCGITSEDVRKGEEFVNELQNIAKDHNIHIHLVAHQNKNSEAGPEDSIRGSGMFADIADNIWQVKVNTAKMELKTSNKLEEEDDKTMPDYWVKLVKQRHSTVIVPRTFGFWGDASMQFKPWKGARRLYPQDWENRRWA